MRAAPPVSVRGNGGMGWRLLQAALPALAAGVLCTWALGHLEQPMLWGALPAALAGVLAWWRSAVPAASLVWAGARWTADGTSGRINVMIDLGGWLLLRLQPDAGGPRRWMAIAATEAGSAWHGLRAALYAQRMAPADPRTADAGPPR